MSAITTTTAVPSTDKVISRGSLVAVEVMGVPGKSGSDAVWTYEAHSDVQVGDLVLVDAPAWTVRVTGHAQLPGFVLGLAASSPLDKRDIKVTLPLAGATPSTHTQAELELQVVTWRAQADAFRTAATSIDAAADAAQAALERL